MDIFTRIKLPIVDELKEFDIFFRTHLKSNVPILSIIINYLIKNKGKQLRPILVLLSAKLFGEINKSSYVAASLIEYLHTATLIHDDIVDNSYERRGVFSVNALWKNKISVLVGDYLLAKGLLIAIDNNEHRLLNIISEAVKEMSEGELLQVEKARKIDISEKLYYEIISKKTATLFASSALIGAITTTNNESYLKLMKEFGHSIGMAFQIKDDLFDFINDNNTGKPAGNDLREQKYTLPLIYAINNASDKDKTKAFSLLKKIKYDFSYIDDLKLIIEKYGGFEYTQNKLNDFVAKAKKILIELPKNEINVSLQLLTDYISSREK
ncbi:MAG: polyprenyl synthetase family protein [Bacteroidales bacterium]|nr:polyprenyl synthetase family protein [Bacteroidales bacterium]